MMEINKSSQKGMLSIVAGAVVLLGVFFVTTGMADEARSNLQAPSENDVPEAVSTTTIDYFENLSLVGTVAYVYDLREGETLYSKNATEKTPLASLTKLMTALIALENIPDPSEFDVQIQPLSLNQDGENGLYAYEQWKMLDLIEFMLVTSSNDAADAVAQATKPLLTDGDFVAEMNSRALELGMKDTSFKNPTGLDINNETEPSAVGTASDMARLATYIYRKHPEIFEMTIKENVSSSRYVQTNTNEILDSIPWIVGSKTGFTDHAGGNLIVVFDAGLSRPIIVAVMGSTVDDRFTDVERLINASFKQISAS